MAYTAYYPTVVAGASNTKGAYAEIVASSPYNSSRLLINARSSAVVHQFFLIDIATGASGSETVVVANIPVVTDSDAISGAFIVLNVNIPVGTRVAVRCQSVTISSQIVLNVLLESRALGSLANPVTFGADTANSRGTQLDPGGTVYTNGSYVQFSPSTPSHIDSLLLLCTINAQGAGISAFIDWRVDIATGAAGSEVVLASNISCIANLSARAARPNVMYLPVSIPAGTRLAARCMCGVTTATERLLCVTLIGMQEPVSSGGLASSAAYLG